MDCEQEASETRHHPGETDKITKFFPTNKRGAVAQLGERIVRNDEVAGSIPASSTNLLNLLATIQPFRATCDNYRNSYAQPPGHAFAKAAPQVDTSGSRVWPSYGKPLTDEGERLYLLRLDLL